MVSEKASLLGSYAFFVGVILAVIAGFVPLENYPVLGLILFVAGIIVGLLNITAKEAMGFLAASTVLVIVSALSADLFTIITLNGQPILRNIMGALLLVFAPATIVVALRAVFGLAATK